MRSSCRPNYTSPSTYETRQSEMKKPLTFTEFKSAVASVPTKSISFRELGGNKIEMISVVKGRVTRLGFIKLT